MKQNLHFMYGIGCNVAKKYNIIRNKIYLITAAPYIDKLFWMVLKAGNIDLSNFVMKK